MKTARSFYLRPSHRHAGIVCSNSPGSCIQFLQIADFYFWFAQSWALSPTKPAFSFEEPVALSELFQRADEAVRKLSENQFFLETDGPGSLYLVKARTRERVQLPSVNGHSISNAERLARIPSLSERERQIFEMLGDGSDTNTIADRLAISVKTVETFRTRLKQKLEVESRTLLLALAVEWKLSQKPSENR